MAHRVLVIEDNHDIAELVKLHLTDCSCTVQLAFDGTDGLNAAGKNSYDLIILDLMLPGIDGIEVCRRLRAGANYTPILMLTSRSTELTRLLGPSVGADDYLAKPFSVTELLACVKTILRKTGKRAATNVKAATKNVYAGNLAIDVKMRSVKLNGAPIDLTAKEFDLLLHLAQNPGHVYTRKELLDTIWSRVEGENEHGVNLHIGRLRAKIERHPEKPELIQTIRGAGYKFSELVAVKK